MFSEYRLPRIFIRFGQSVFADLKELGKIPEGARLDKASIELKDKDVRTILFGFK